MSLLFAVQLSLCVLGVGDIRHYPFSVQQRCAPIRDARAALPAPTSSDAYRLSVPREAQR